MTCLATSRVRRPASHRPAGLHKETGHGCSCAAGCLTPAQATAQASFRIGRVPLRHCGGAGWASCLVLLRRHGGRSRTKGSKPGVVRILEGMATQ